MPIKRFQLLVLLFVLFQITARFSLFSFSKRFEVQSILNATLDANIHLCKQKVGCSGNVNMKQIVPSFEF